MSVSHTILDRPRSRRYPRRAEMRAAVYRGPGRVVIEYVPVPEISDGEVLIRVAACGICGTDIKKIQHGFVAPPQIFGHEVAGTVVAVGRGVSRWKVGDRVGEFSPRSLRELFLLRAAPVFAVPGLQESRPDRGLRSQWRRLRRIRARHAMDCRARHGGNSRGT